MVQDSVWVGGFRSWGGRGGRSQLALVVGPFFDHRRQLGTCTRHTQAQCFDTMRRRKTATAESSDDDDDVNSPRGAPPDGPFSSASSSQNSVDVAESRLRKVIVRSVVGFFMVTSFVGIVWAGHLYLSALVVLIQVGLPRAVLLHYSSCGAEIWGYRKDGQRTATAAAVPTHLDELVQMNSSVVDYLSALRQMSMACL